MIFKRGSGSGSSEFRSDLGELPPPSFELHSFASLGKPRLEGNFKREVLPSRGIYGGLSNDGSPKIEPPVSPKAQADAGGHVGH